MNNLHNNIDDENLQLHASEQSASEDDKEAFECWQWHADSDQRNSCHRILHRKARQAEGVVTFASKNTGSETKMTENFGHT